LKNKNNIFEYIKEKKWNEHETISFISSVYLFKTYSERNNFIQFLDEGNLDNNEIILLNNILNSTNDITHLINSFNIIKKNNDINKENHLDIIRSLSAYNPIERLLIAEKLKDFDAETTESIAVILKIIFFMPSTHHETFINYIKTMSEQEIKYYENSINNDFFCILKNCFHNTADDLKKNWLDHWHKILISYNKEHVIALVNFINAHKNDIHFEENDIKLTITIPPILGCINNSYINHQNLLKKRQTFTKVSHEALHIDEIENQKISLNPQFFETLSNKLSIDPSSVPKISPDVFLSVLDGIEKDMENKEVAAEVYGLIGDFNNLKHNISSNDSYLVFLLNTSADHLIGAQFKCIMNHILSLPKERLPNQLSDQQAAYLKTIYSIFACPVGKDAGIVNAYISLPNQSKLLFNNNTDNEEMNDEYVESVSHQKTLNFIYSMLQENIDQRFYNNDLLCGMCKLDPSLVFNIDNIAQPVHQSLYLRNLIGDLVGSRYGVEFDFYYFENNTSPYFLNLKRQKAIDTYYEHAKPNAFIKFIQAKINEALEIEFAKKGSPSSDQTRHIYNGISDMLAETISPNDIWDIEEDDDFMPISIKIKDKAVFELLLKVKAIIKI
ncbi:MAG: hypothetical protein Q8L85_10075, partial [Alphaproteobacteria bacterium]|nr:hypothetical protein [Alphaproteobacteria bacterium]